MNFCHIARFRIPEGRNLHCHEREELKPHILPSASQLNGATSDRIASLQATRKNQERNGITLRWFHDRKLYTIQTKMKRYLCKCSAGYMLLIPQCLNPRSYIYQKSNPARWFRQVKLLRTVMLWNSSEMTQYFPFFPAGWLVKSSKRVDLNGIVCDQRQDNTTKCCCQSWRLASECLAKAEAIRLFIHSILWPSLGARDN